MSKEFFLPVPHYLQVDCYNDTNVKCGAACTQMVLHDIDLLRPFTRGEQNSLFGVITNPLTGGNAWHNPPQGIKRVLNDEKPAPRLGQRASLKPEIQALFSSLPADQTIPYEFVILGDSSADSNPNPGMPRAIDTRDQITQIELLSRHIIRTVALRGVAPIVAVREDNAHWIVVNGFHVEDDYHDSNPRQRKKIRAIHIRNPLGRYAYRDVECGSSPVLTQQITGHKCNLDPYHQDVVPFATWVREFMFSDWAETFVDVCDQSGQVTDDLLSRIHCLASNQKSWLSAICNWLARVYRAICRLFPKRQISDKGAADRAQQAIKNFNLSQINKNVIPGNTLPPYKVKRLDRIDGDYFLVPVGVGKKISALISISIRGEFDGATVLPINAPRECDIKYVRPNRHCPGTIEKDPGIVEFYRAIARPNEHYISPFDDHPDFIKLTSGENSSLRGRKIRLTKDGPALTITSVIRDAAIPYVWRPGAEPSSASRPFHNLKLTVEGRQTPISYYLPVDDYCLPVDSATGDVALPSANYLEMVAECIKQRAGNKVDEVLALINRRGTTAMVMYKSNQTRPIKDELEDMRVIICQCLNANPSPGLTHFRIKAFATNAFLTRHRGGGEDGPIGTAPPSGGGENDIPINPCP